MISTASKKAEVKVRGVNVSYSEATLNLVFGLGNVEDTFQNLLETSNDQDYNIYMESLCNPRTKWVEAGGEKTMRIMDLDPESKVWYQFAKHSLGPTAHNVTVSKDRLVLLNCVTSFSEVNVAKIIV